MKILPKKVDIDRAKANEKKIQIDEGVALATKIDFLRQTALKEEKSLLDWRNNNIEKVKEEIDDYITVRDNLQKETEKAEIHRQELLKPLDSEWLEINKEKSKLTSEKKNIYLLREQQKEERKLLDIEQNKIRNIATEIGKKHIEIEKAKVETINLKELAQREYEVARDEHITQTKEYENSLSNTRQKEREYEVGVSTNEIKEKQLEEKEAELIIRENELTRRTNNLQRVEKIK